MAILAGPVAAQEAEWKSQYYYDQAQSSLVIRDLQFASAQRGVAVGYVVKGSSRKPAAVVTSDGGAHWELSKPEEMPVSLFFLNEGLGWMVAENSLWKTTEAGRNWSKVSGLPRGRILRVYFLDADNGWAVGLKKTVLETHDGGVTWTPVKAASTLPGAAAYSAYTFVAFATPKWGLIAGYNRPPRRAPAFPGWLDPQGATYYRDVPHLNYTLETNDAGKTWRPASASLFGDTTKIRFRPDGTGIGLIEYSQQFRLASEVFTVDWTTGKSESIYKDAKFGVKDVWKMPDGTVYLAGTVAQGQMRDLVEERVQVLSSRDGKTFRAMGVDYRAVAHRVSLACPDGRNVWMATDTGMILKLAPTEAAGR
jgi:photosystem II stability/assembly factor-like uncharacterized protein